MAPGALGWPVDRCSTKQRHTRRPKRQLQRACPALGFRCGNVAVMSLVLIFGDFILPVADVTATSPHLNPKQGEAAEVAVAALCASSWCCSGPPANSAHLGPWRTHPDPAVSFRQSTVRQWACSSPQRIQKAASVASKPAARKMKISSMADANDQDGGPRAQDTCCVLVGKWFVC